jgi:hypothetical protein
MAGATAYEFVQEALLPVEVRITKKGEANAPADGLVVKTGDVLSIQISDIPAEGWPLAADDVIWCYRQLQADRSYPSDWATFGDDGKGVKFEYTTTQGGVFQIKAIIMGEMELSFVRKTDEIIEGKAYGGGRIGQRDAVGVADSQGQIYLRNEAKCFYASTAYRYEDSIPSAYGWPAYPVETNKCNIFVAHRIRAAGLPLAAINGALKEFPPLANEWGGIEDTEIIIDDPTYIPNWRILPAETKPQPGFIIAYPTLPTGHVGVVDYDGTGIAAGSSGTVNKNHPFLGSRMRRYELSY